MAICLVTKVSPVGSTGSLIQGIVGYPLAAPSAKRLTIKSKHTNTIYTQLEI